VEQTLFNLDPKPTAPRHWLDDTWLNSSSRPIQNFGEFDWDHVPKIDYAKVLFRQLATPENAKVFDEDVGFVLETFGKIKQIEVTPEEEIEIQAKAFDDAELHLQVPAEEPAPREPLPLPELADPALLLGSESFWSPPDAHTLDSLPFDAHAAPELDSAALAAAREDAYAQGLADGLQTGQQQGHALGHAEGLTAGHAQALEDAQTQANAQMQSVLEAEKTRIEESLNEQLKVLQALNDQLRSFTDKPDALFEPIKRLAVHISEQLVLAELNLSGQAIERLVQRCLDELDMHGQSPIVVELNPQDKARLQDINKDVLNHMQLQAVASLHPGSVRVVVNDTQIEDLIEHRLQAMANRLLNQPEQWREQSAFFRQPLAQRDGQAEDVPQRMVFDEPPKEDDHD
jgi:flagellar assembly protein FliH